MKTSYRSEVDNNDVPRCCQGCSIQDNKDVHPLSSDIVNRSYWAHKDGVYVCVFHCGRARALTSKWDAFDSKYCSWSCHQNIVSHGRWFRGVVLCICLGTVPVSLVLSSSEQKHLSSFQANAFRSLKQRIPSPPWPARVNEYKVSFTEPYVVLVRHRSIVIYSQGIVLKILEGRNYVET